MLRSQSLNHWHSHLPYIQNHLHCSQHLIYFLEESVQAKSTDFPLFLIIEVHDLPSPAHSVLPLGEQKILLLFLLPLVSSDLIHSPSINVYNIFPKKHLWKKCKISIIHFVLQLQNHIKTRFYGIYCSKRVRVQIFHNPQVCAWPSLEVGPARINLHPNYHNSPFLCSYYPFYRKSAFQIFLSLYS